MNEGIWLLILLFAVVYYIPTIVAHYKGHKQKMAITVLNVFGGWTGILWLAALVWAVMKSDKEEVKKSKKR